MFAFFLLFLYIFLPNHFNWIWTFLFAVVISTASVNKADCFCTLITEPCNVQEIHLGRIVLDFHKSQSLAWLYCTFPTSLPAVMDTLWFSADSWLPRAGRGSTRATVVITHPFTRQSLEEPEDPPGKKCSWDTTGSFMQEQSGVCVKEAQELKHHVLRICPCFSYLL